VEDCASPSCEWKLTMNQYWLCDGLKALEDKLNNLVLEVDVWNWVLCVYAC
jgi:hypothetical protein